MSVDPRDPDTFEEDLGAEESDSETSEADAAEQHAELLQHRDAPVSERAADSVNPADAAEQARVVEVNEDEYR
jgi:hypothetical protein